MAPGGEWKGKKGAGGGTKGTGKKGAGAALPEPEEVWDEPQAWQGEATTTYRGGVRRGAGGEWVRHGRGETKYADGNYYRGGYKDDVRHGHGEHCIAGTTYVGHFREKKRCGQGTATGDDGKVASGAWRDNKLHGQGREVWPTGTVREGAYVKGRLHGWGACVRTFTAGERAGEERERYDGEWADGERHGYGMYWTLRLSPALGKFVREEYEGGWRTGKQHGRGVAVYFDGERADSPVQSRFEGAFEDGSRVKGTLITYGSDGREAARFDGSWEDNALSGPRGTAVYCREGRQDRLEGEFKGGVLHGAGRKVETTAEGEVAVEYAGGFCQGRYEGEGTLATPGARSITLRRGTFRRGVLHGRGEASGSATKYVGDFVSGRYEGHGVLQYLLTNQCYEGGFVNGRQETSEAYPVGWLRVPDQGEFFTGGWKAGRRHGDGVLERRVNQDGEGFAAVTWRGTWVDGRMMGRAVITKPQATDTAVYEGDVDGGQEHGQGNLHIETAGGARYLKYSGAWRRGKFDGDGRVYYAGRGDDGGDDFTRFWYKGSFRSGQRDGYGEEQNDDGRYVGFFRRGGRHGQGRLVRPDGHAAEGTFVNGMLQGRALLTEEGQRFEARFTNGAEELNTRVLIDDGMAPAAFDGSEDDVEGNAEGDEDDDAAPMVVTPLGDGRARLEYPSGAVYEGGCARGTKATPDGALIPCYVKNGFGCETRAGGWKYEGMWLSSRRHGHGRVETDTYHYEGAWEDNAKHGRGRLVYTNTGFEYEGDFVRGRRTGYCHRMVLVSGTVYQGDVEDGRWHGRGTATYRNGDTYTGEYREDVRHGRGRHVKIDGSVYEGEFVDGKYHGAGVRYTEGVRHEGLFADGLEHGEGTRRYTSGEGERVLEGTFVRGRLEGDGQETEWNDGCVVGVYTGAFVDNRRHGVGVQEVLGEYVYSGGWADGKWCGEGKCEYEGGKVVEGVFGGDGIQTGTTVWAGQKRYVGAYVNGAPHGEGIMTAVTYEYCGTFRNGQRHGHGRTVCPYSGKVDEAEWVHDKRDGPGAMTNKDGVEYSGTFRSNLLEGAGVAKYPNGDEYRGDFRNGRRDGRGVLTRKDGAQYSGGWREDRKHGAQEWRIPSVPGAPVVVQVLNYEAGVPCGPAAFLEDGRVLCKGVYVDGCWEREMPPQI